MTVSISLDTKHMLKDVQSLTRERGQTVKIFPHTESDLERDKFNSIKKRSAEGEKMKAMVNYSPTRYQLEKAGISEDVDVLATFATQDFMDKDLSYKDIDSERWEIETSEGIFTIKDKAQTNQYGEVFLNIAIGLVPK